MYSSVSAATLLNRHSEVTLSCCTACCATTIATSAVSVPALEDHMVDCVVFPAEGSRPHPSQLSGGDLDGDIYFVLFDDTLLPPPASAHRYTAYSHAIH
jgi:RNA dependent RNA polymerase